MLPLFASAQGGLGTFALIVLAILLTLFAGAISCKFFFLLIVSRALGRCRAENRTMSPGQVWLMFIPLFGFVWQFFIARRVPQSLRNEFQYRGLESRSDFGQGVGMAACLFGLLFWPSLLIPFASLAIALAWFVCGVIFWVKIDGYSQKLLRDSERYDFDEDEWYHDEDERLR